MIKLNEEIILDIEKLTFGGLALGRFGEEKFVVFVEGALPDEKVKVKITKLNKKHAKGEILEIIKSSPNRTKPLCALYNACGSCDNQNCDYDYSVFLKTLILKDVFKNVVDEKNIFDVIKSPEILQYRRKIQYPARQTKNSKRILLGYFKNNSHDLTNIKFCPIQPELTNKIAQYIRDNFQFNCYCERNSKGLLKNILLRVSSNNENILLSFVLNCDKENFEKYYREKLSSFAKNIMGEFSEIKGVFANLNPYGTNRILSDTDIKIQGEDFIIENLENKKYKIGPSSFFQVNPKSAINLFNVVKNNIKENSTILDAYGGVGAIGIFISEKTNKITLVEENKNAVLMAKENFKLNNIENYKIFEGDAQKHFIDFEQQKRVFDYVILDPPRKGCSKEALVSLSKLAKNIIYVSCNPQTLKRDLSYLIENGFSAKFVQGVDLFPYTHHIESVVLLEKDKG